MAESRGGRGRLPSPSPGASSPERLPEGSFPSKGQMADLVTPAPAPKPANDVQLRGWPARPFTTGPNGTKRSVLRAGSEAKHLLSVR